MKFCQPAEWERHRAVWSAWPSHPQLWQEDLAAARAQVTALFRAIHDDGRGEPIHLLVDGEEARISAEVALGTMAVLHDMRFGDIWLRDTAPIFVRSDADIYASSFGFNGWGGKYNLPGDSDVAQSVAALAGHAVLRHDWILEGGSIDVDGAGRALTTEQCLLNPNRNPGLNRTDITARLQAALGISQLIWLGEGLLNDHTDGHIDNLARFVGENHAVVPQAVDANDPNAAIYADARARLDAAGVRVTLIPSVGLLEDEDGEAIPASYANFYISNTRVIVPVYGSAQDEAAVAAIAGLFPGRTTIGSQANAILTGGGSFHCITQQVPL